MCPYCDEPDCNCDLMEEMRSDLECDMMAQRLWEENTAELAVAILPPITETIQ